MLVEALLLRVQWRKCVALLISFLLIPPEASSWANTRRGCLYRFVHTNRAPRGRLGPLSSEQGDTVPPSFRRRPLRRPVRPSRTTSQQEQQQKASQNAQELLREALQNDPTLLSNLRFDQLHLHPSLLRGVTERLGLTQLTDIQARTWSSVRNGASVLARARTGTGKTMAFLVPAVQRLLEADAADFRAGRNIGVLIVAPTRELVQQIADQAEQLVSCMGGGGDNGWFVQALYGGTSMGRDVAIWTHHKFPAILVATPGRLTDHIKNTRIRGKKFVDVLGSTRVVVLDEADHLVEGFSKECQTILSSLPRSDKRQTLLFSATVPRRLLAGMKDILPGNHEHVDCVNDADVKADTNSRVDQSYLQLQNVEEGYVATLVSILRDAMMKD